MSKYSKLWVSAACVLLAGVSGFAVAQEKYAKRANNGPFRVVISKPIVGLGYTAGELYREHEYLGAMFNELHKEGLVPVMTNIMTQTMEGRENEDRLIALGVRTPLYKTAAFALSGAIACLAGALYGTHANFVAPSLAGVLFSTEVVVWVAIGGRNSLVGALLGGILVASLSNYLCAIVPRYWQLALGVLFVLLIVYLRGGIAGAITTLFARRARG